MSLDVRRRPGLGTAPWSPATVMHTPQGELGTGRCWQGAFGARIGLAVPGATASAAPRQICGDPEAALRFSGWSERSAMRLPARR